MKTEKQNERHAADHQMAGIQRTVESEFPGFLLNHRLTLAIATLACLALAGGCCTKSTTQARYTPPPATAYTEPPPPPPPPAPAPAPVETAAQPNFVVPLRQETVNVQKREVSGGDVRIKKIIITETVNQPVELRREEVVIDRGPGTGTAKNTELSQAFEPGETVLHLKREEADLQKQVQPAGEIVVSTRSTSEQKTLTAQVRREDIDTAQLAGIPNVIIGQNLKAVGGAGSPGSTSSGAYSSDVITDPATLASADSSTKLTGRSVRFDHIQIRKVLGDRLLEVGNDSDRRCYAVMNDKSVTARPGDFVNITGKLQSREGFTPQTGVDESGAQLLMKQPYYIEVQKIEVAPQ